MRADELRRIAAKLPPPLRRTALYLYRFGMRMRMPWPYLGPGLGHAVRWLLVSNEVTNFTYDLTPINQRYLTALLADVSGRPYAEIAGYIAELESDHELRAHIRTTTLRHDAWLRADAEARYGRRLGWYALVRALRPRIIVETGVDKGLGACVLTAALRRNTQEGAPGYYYGTDINPAAGYLLAGPYQPYGEILYGDSINSLQRLNQKVDLFINDSDHSPEYEAREYGTIAPHLSPEAVILSDNAHVTDCLLEFALATGRSFVFFKEQPANHWYPGAGIGIAFRRHHQQ